MSVVESRVIFFNPVFRVVRLLVSPAREWDRIDAEPARIPQLYLGYVGVLAAIPPTAKVLGFQHFGHGMIPLAPTVAGAVVQYALSLIAVFVLALAIDALAPSFDGRRDRAQAFKMTAYGGTGYWVLGVLGLLPLLGWLGGFVSVYLYHVGLPRLMKTPKEKAFLYTLATVGCALALFVAISTVANLAAGWVWASSQPIMSNTPVSAADTAAAKQELDAMDKELEASIKAYAVAEARAKAEEMNAPIPGLNALLPNEVGSYGMFGGQSQGAETASARTSMSDYVWGSSRFTLAITDLGALSVTDNIAKAAQAPSLRKSATGYERAEKLGDRLVTEQWDSATRSGRYGMVVANRFVIEASSHDVGIDVLKQAVNAVDASRLDVLAREAKRP